MPRIYCGSLPVSVPVSDALRGAGWVVVPGAAPQDAPPEDLALVVAREGITPDLRHAINNPLTAVMGFAELLVRQPELPEEVRSRLVTIRDHARQVRDLLRKAEGRDE